MHPGVNICQLQCPDFQGPGVIPMTPEVNIEHQILGKPAEESTAPVQPESSIKKEDDWDLIPTGPELAEGNVIDISSSSESESSVSEMSLSSDEEGPPLQERAPKIAKWQAKPSVDEQWFQHPVSKIIQAASVHDPQATRISVCGSIMKSPFLQVTEAAEWTYKCRICFAGRRQPVIT